MRWVLCRPRDEHGSLIRRNPDLPWWVTTDAKGQWKIDPKMRQSYSQAFLEVMKRRGLDERQQRIALAEFKRDNPTFGRKGE